MLSGNSGFCAMSGNRYFLDTNAIVQLLAGNPDVIDILSGASYIAISVICELEFLSFPASAHACVLLTADKRLQKVSGLPVRTYRPA